MPLKTILSASLMVVASLLAGRVGGESKAAEAPQESVSAADAPTYLMDIGDSSVTWHFEMTPVYQQNVHGGLSTSRRAGRYAGSYDLAASVDMERLLGLSDSIMYLRVEGGWPSAGSIDPAAVGSYLGVNYDAIPGEWADVAEFCFIQALAGDRLFLHAGKIDLTAGFQHRHVVAAFDLNWYANDETSQFLNGALVQNPTIPFPANTLGVNLLARPSERWQIAGAVTIQSDDTDIDEIASWASAEQGYFGILEASFAPQVRLGDTTLDGWYHLGGWWSGDGDEAPFDRDRTGVYLGLSQEVFREDDDPDGGQGLGLFARYGLTDGAPSDLRTFWSVGLQYTGLLESRPADVLGIGYANGRFTDSDEPDAFEGGERVIEAYYRMALTPEVSLSPSVQYVANPGGRTGDDALVLGLRARIVLE
jgi:porin